jgi:hypothetical protein
MASGEADPKFIITQAQRRRSTLRSPPDANGSSEGTPVSTGRRRSTKTKPVSSSAKYANGFMGLPAPILEEAELHDSGGLPTKPATPSLVEERGWDYEDDEHGSVVLRADRSQWQLGLSGEDSPNVLHNMQDWQTVLNRKRAREVMAAFIDEHCDGILPHNILIIIAAHNYSAGPTTAPASLDLTRAASAGGDGDYVSSGAASWAEWEEFVLQSIGFRGFLVVDARHMVLYASGRTGGTVVEVSEEGISCLCAHGGFVIPRSVSVQPWHWRSSDSTKASASMPAVVAQIAAVARRAISRSPVDLRRELLKSVCVGVSGAAWLEEVKGLGPVLRRREDLARELKKVLKEAILRTHEVPSVIDNAAEEEEEEEEEEEDEEDEDDEEEKELAAAAVAAAEGKPFKRRLRVKVIYPAEAKYSSWIGGSSLAILSAIQMKWARGGSSVGEANPLRRRGSRWPSAGGEAEIFRSYLFGSFDADQLDKEVSSSAAAADKRLRNSYWRLMRGDYDDRGTNLSGLMPEYEMHDINHTLFAPGAKTWYSRHRRRRNRLRRQQKYWHQRPWTREHGPWQPRPLKQTQQNSIKAVSTAGYDDEENEEDDDDDDDDDDAGFAAWSGRRTHQAEGEAMNEMLVATAVAEGRSCARRAEDARAEMMLELRTKKASFPRPSFGKTDAGADDGGDANEGAGVQGSGYVKTTAMRVDKLLLSQSSLRWTGGIFWLPCWGAPGAPAPAAADGDAEAQATAQAATEAEVQAGVEAGAVARRTEQLQRRLESSIIPQQVEQQTQQQQRLDELLAIIRRLETEQGQGISDGGVDAKLNKLKATQANERQHTSHNTEQIRQLQSMRSMRAKATARRASMHSGSTAPDGQPTSLPNGGRSARRMSVLSAAAGTATAAKNTSPSNSPTHAGDLGRRRATMAAAMRLKR